MGNKTIVPKKSNAPVHTKSWEMGNKIIVTRIVFLRKNRSLPPFDVKSMSHLIQFQTETLNTISYGNSSHFM